MAGQPPWLPIPGRSCLVKLLSQVTFKVFFSSSYFRLLVFFVGIVAYGMFIVDTGNVIVKIGDLARCEFLASDPQFFANPEFCRPVFR
jgi:hypothetical protein